MKLQSYLGGRWQSGTSDGRALVNPVTGVEIARADATGIDLSEALRFSREVGGASLRQMTFGERGAVLKAIANTLSANRSEYFEIAKLNSGNTAADAAVDIDGAIGTLKYYARLSTQLGSAQKIVESGSDQLAREPTFLARHVWLTRPGVAVQVNAFNFPAWGMWEKVAQATLAGVPSLSKPATATAMLTERMVRDVIAATVAPEGAISLLCGNAEGILSILGPMDSCAFTGSASTARILRRQAAEAIAAPRLTVEADSINATVLGPDVTPDSELFKIAVREVTKALQVKAGQLCTNIRRVFVPKELAREFAAALCAEVERFVVGDPGDSNTTVGPLINASQRDDVLQKIRELRAEASLLIEGRLPEHSPEAAFVAPTVLFRDELAGSRAVHEIEVFGPCVTVLPYSNLAQAHSFIRAGQGSLALSLFSDDEDVKEEMINSVAPWNGRVMIVDSEVGKSHTGHSIVMPQCLHGGPGRAGNGEELGGLRGLRFHMQRTAVQGGPAMLGRLARNAVEASL